MLVLTRRLSERVKETDIMITTPTGDVITIALKQIKGKQVRIGLTTPSLAYIIDRAENYEEAKAAREKKVVPPIISAHFAIPPHDHSIT